MRRYLMLAFLVFILAGLSSCTEDEFIEPATVDLKIRMTNPEPFDDQQGGGPPFEDELEFSSGKLQLSSIEFEGERENNDRHYFSRDFSELLVADLSEGELNQSVRFDIPQGSYKHIRLRLHTCQADTCAGLVFRGRWGRDDDDDDEDDDDDDDSSKKQAFQMNDPEEMPIELNFYEKDETIPLTVKTKDNQQQILIEKDNYESLEITIDLAHMFRTINPGRLRQAQVHGSGNQRRIIVSAQHNTDLYFSLADRVERSITAVIK